MCCTQALTPDDTSTSKEPQYTILTCTTDVVYREYSARTYLGMQSFLCFTCRTMQAELSKLDMFCSRSKRQLFRQT